MSDGIIYLQKDKFDFYSSLTGKVIEFGFIPEIVRDLEVTNSELLENLIKLFIANNKLPTGGLIIVLADNASFIKDFQLPAPPPVAAPGSQVVKPPVTPANSPNQEDVQKEIDFFIEHVPYDDVSSATYPMSNGSRVWATNKAFYQSIADAFQKQGFEIRAVLPGLVFEGGIGSKPVLDIITANKIFQALYSVRQHSLLIQKTAEFHPIENKMTEEAKNNQNTEESTEVKDQQKPKANKKRLVLMVVVFTILIVVMVIMFITQKPLG